MNFNFCFGSGSTASGITLNARGGRGDNARDITNTVVHEYGHYLFGAQHTAVSGLMSGSPYEYYGTTYAMSAWEREHLGYINPSSVFDGYSHNLTDYASTGDAIKIPISSGEYLFVENHQRLGNIYYDDIIYSGIPISQGKGIYVWYVQNGDTYPPSVWALTADGSWNWTFAGNDTLFGFNSPPPILPGVNRSSRNLYLPNIVNCAPYNIGEPGHGDRNPFAQYPIGTSVGYAQIWESVNPLTKKREITRNIMGDSTDAFRSGYNNLLTPWSNPSTTKYINGSPSPTNISLQILANSGNNVPVRVYLTQTNALSLPPSKPQNLKVTSDPIHANAVLTWEANKEPDMNSGSYKIYRTTSSGGEPGTFSFVTSINAFNGSTPVTTWTDENWTAGSGSLKLFYKISAVDNTAQESNLSEYDWINYDLFVQKKNITNNSVNAGFSLGENFPNPFNPETVIKYSLAVDSKVSIKVYDLLGSEVADLVNETQSSGLHSVKFNGSNLPSGVYLVRMTSGSFSDSRKIVLMK